MLKHILPPEPVIFIELQTVLNKLFDLAINLFIPGESEGLLTNIIQQFDYIICRPGSSLIN